MPVGIVVTQKTIKIIRIYIITTFIIAACLMSVEYVFQPVSVFIKQSAAVKGSTANQGQAAFFQFVFYIALPVYIPILIASVISGINLVFILFNQLRNFSLAFVGIILLLIINSLYANFTQNTIIIKQYPDFSCQNCILVYNLLVFILFVIVIIAPISVAILVLTIRKLKLIREHIPLKQQLLSKWDSKTYDQGTPHIKDLSLDKFGLIQAQDLQIGDLIGKGSFGNVYAGVLWGDTKVAVKIYKQSF